MRVVDTSAWIEWLMGSSVGIAIDSEMPDRTEWLVPTVVQLELAKWLTRELGEEKADSIVAFTKTCIVVDLTTPIALLAASLGTRHKLAMADAIVYATAVSQGADLLTCDRHFEGLDGVRLFSKSPSVARDER